MKVLCLIPCEEVRPREYGYVDIIGAGDMAVEVSQLPVTIPMTVYGAFALEPEEVPGPRMGALTVVGPDVKFVPRTFDLSTTPYRRWVQRSIVFTVTLTRPGPHRIEVSIQGQSEGASWPFEVELLSRRDQPGLQRS